MADSLTYNQFLPKTFARATLPVRAYEPEQFTASPVDEVLRAIKLGEQLQNLATKIDISIALRVTDAFTGASVETRWISALFRNEIGAETLQTNVDFFWYAGGGSHFETDLVTAALPPGQLALGMAGDFSPSKKLTDIWISSLSALAREAGRQVHISADFEAAQEFSKTLYSVLGTIAQQLRYESPSDILLTRQNRFTPTYQIQLCDAFLIIPDQAAFFLDLLYSELSDAVGAGCDLNGDWGELRVNPAKDLYFRLSPPDLVVDPNFVESEEVE